MGDSDVIDCNGLHHMANLTDYCGFVKNTSACDIDEGFINYTQFLYCTLSDIPIWFACIILLIWWLFLFCGLAVTADDFFCPSLAVISQNLKLSHNVAGVTFLAFGNGAPDIFSAIAAIGNAKAGDAGLAIGALFGAGVFVTAVVAGSIAIIKPFRSMERPFLRDVIFYLAACFWAWYVMWDKKISQMEAAGFIILYAFYVLVVIIGRYINQRLKNRRNGPLMEAATVSPDLRLDMISEETPEDRVLGESIENSEADRETLDPLLKDAARKVISAKADIQIEQDDLQRILHDDSEKSENQIIAFLQDINPIDHNEWHGKKFYWKIYEVFKCPLVLLLKLTVPIVAEKDEDEPDSLRNWNRPLNSLHLFTGPVFGIFVTELGFNKVGGVFPVYGIVILACAALSVLVFYVTKKDRRPFFHTGFAYLGFLVAVLWIYSVANEIVNILQALGVVFDLSDAILGLTLLAWGNSIGDLIADMAMARQGYPRMGISACFGGPLFNLLLGLGIPFSIACAKKGGTFHLKVTLEEMVLAAGLAASLVASLVIVPCSGFKMSRPYGIFLLCLYVAFLVVAVLTEVNVINNFSL